MSINELDVVPDLQNLEMEMTPSDYLSKLICSTFINQEYYSLFYISNETPKAFNVDNEGHSPTIGLIYKWASVFLKRDIKLLEFTKWRDYLREKKDHSLAPLMNYFDRGFPHPSNTCSLTNTNKLRKIISTSPLDITSTIIENYFNYFISLHGNK